MNDGRTPADLLTLPQGGGALSGLGETFEADLQTGTGNLTIPIALPASDVRPAPRLELTYSTGRGNGPFGVGWDVPLPRVARRTSHGIPTYDDSRDTFLLSSREELVPIPGGDADVTPYRPAAEGLFARITHERGGGGDYWQVRSSDGSRARYGSEPATVAGGGADPATVCARPGATLAWRVTLTEDAFGNRVEYRYLRDPATSSGAAGSGQLYLEEVAYGDYGAAPNIAFAVRVRFFYEERPDHVVDGSGGFPLATTLRCSRIEIRTGPGATTPARVYHLKYADETDPARPANGASLLTEIQAEGRDGAVSEWLPPLRFGYSAFAPDRRDLMPVDGEGLPDAPLGLAPYVLADTTGDGLPDLLSLENGLRIWRNNGGAAFALPHDVRDAPAGVRMEDGTVEILDADGDGRLDVLVTEPVAGYFPLRFDERWDPRSLHRISAAPSFDLRDPQVRLLDLDGDGVTDAVRSGTRLECFFGDRSAGWRKARAMPRRALDEFPNVSFDDPRVRIADMAGDGGQAIVLVHPGRIDYWAARADGEWSERVTMRNAPRLPQDWDPARLLLGDVDGDGTADLVYVESGRVTLCLNQGGRSWSETIQILGTPPVHSGVSVQLVDLLGTGMLGLLWSGSRTNGRRGPYFLDFCARAKPYLLDRIDNNIGALTRIRYESSTESFVRDEAPGQTPWRAALPRPVHVVAQVETIDRLSGGKLTTEYRYHHGYWDGAAREFRGFGRVDRIDSESFAGYSGPGLHDPDEPREQLPRERFSPPQETRTWFHLGDVSSDDAHAVQLDYGDEFWDGDGPALSAPTGVTELLDALPPAGRRAALRALRGRILRVETYGRDGDRRAGQPYRVTEFLHGVFSLPLGQPLGDPPDDWQLRSFFPCLLAQRTTDWERGDDPMTRLRFLGSFDEYGHARSQLDVAVPRGRGYRVALDAQVPHEPYLMTRTMTEYARRDDDQVYLVDRVASVTTTSLDLGPYELARGESPAATGLEEAVAAGLTTDEVIGQSVSFCDGAPFVGLPFGEIGLYGALTRRETLVLTGDLMTRAYREADGTSWRPPYLESSGTPGPEYPSEFIAAGGPLAGFVERIAAPYTPGLFARAERRAYDFHDPKAEPRGLVTASRDPRGNDTTIEYDATRHVPVKIRDAVGLTTEATVDTRLLRPDLITDPNGNRTRLGFTSWGLLASVARRGKAGESVGDPDTAPGTTHAYDFQAFAQRGAPISVTTTRRIHSATETSVPEPERSATVAQAVYCDGFGRVLQTRTLVESDVFGDDRVGDAGLSADPKAALAPAVATSSAGPRVVVRDARTYDNKGQIVEQLEPWFDIGWKYGRAPPTALRTRFFYDATGAVVRTVAPDGSEARLVRGVPGSIAAPALGDPTTFDPTPWESYVYEPNDNVARTHALDPRAGRLAAYADTPRSVLRDALGRVVETVERCRAPTAAGGLSLIQEARTTSRFDALGNVVEVRDPLGRPAMRSVHALDGGVLRAEWLDSGVSRIVRDAAGNTLEQRDDRGALQLQAYDALGRPARRWARDEAGSQVTLRERLEYGDGGTAGQAAAVRAAQAAANRLGRLYEHYDEAGLLVAERYDHRGNVVERTRRVIRDERFEDAFAAAVSWRVDAFRTDWTVASGSSLAARRSELLSAASYTTAFALDALDRATSITAPAADGLSGARSVTSLRYDPVGRVTRVELDGAVVVSRAAYDARGRPILIVHPPTAGGPGLMRRLAYDRPSGRLVRQRTEQWRDPAGAGSTFEPVAGGQVVQDLRYEYDLAGTVLAITDGAAGSPTARTFAYDSLSRLVEESSRECANPPAEPWFDAGLCTLGATRAYTERLTFDLAGNVSSLAHTAGGATTVKTFTLAPGTNRLQTVAAGGTTYGYAYDSAGNLTSETESRHFEWDHADRLRVFREQVRAGGTTPDDDQWAEPSVHVHYLYDAAGVRVLKVVRRQGGALEVTTYVGDFEHRRWSESGSAKSASLVDLALGGLRVAVDRRGDTRAGEPGPGTQFHVTDRLGSTVVLLDDGYAELDRESYSAFGRTNAGGSVANRARFVGQRRDEESGLCYFGARYYAPWLARWTSCDPAGAADGLNPYVYARNDPASRRDPDGRQSRRDSTSNLTEAAASGTTIGNPEPDEAWALPRLPKTTPSEPVEPDEPEERRSVGGAIWDWLTRDRTGPPATPTPPPAPPPVITDRIYSDDATLYEFKPDEPIDAWPRIYRRVQTSAETWAIEASADYGRTWKPTERIVGTSSATGVITPEEQAQRELEQRAEGTLYKRIGWSIVGGFLGAVAFGLMMGLFGAIGVSQSLREMFGPFGFLASVAVGSLIFGLAVQPDDRPPRNLADYPTLRIG